MNEDLAPLLQRHGRRFAAGERLFGEGEPAREAFVLHEGRVRLIKRVRSVERSLTVLRPGDVFGEIALLDGAVCSSTAVALTEGVALVLDHPTMRGMLTSHPPLALRILEQLVRRVRDAEDQIELLMLEGAQSKIVGALLKLAQRAATAHADASVALSPVELSARVGLDVETVKRTVARLREQGYLRILDERIEIPDVDALRRLYVLLGTPIHKSSA